MVLIAANKDRIEGTIDVVTKDGSYLWLRQGHGQGRQLFYHCDGYQILVDPRAE
ncbi:hypothetical protein [Arthrobacter sp. ISL-30]|uniref:hypothetical protein n=1 Tax=Arthrobacter sp. ISL-30 TaxID=2819109 RepID=UPI001BEBF919|nr:hypothetical protein [Arthrobacter sp. ISL-30]MBT2513615.1 hypothetical protein [Arthrobacter sp. ISL-30]